MATLIKGNSLMADKNGDPLFGDRQANVSDAAVTLATLSATAPATLSAASPATLSAGTTALMTVTWGTNDPGGTPDGTITITDGNVLERAEIHEFVEEYEGNMITLKALADELITDHATFKALADELILDHATSKTLQDELILDHAITITDLTTMKTKINAILDVLEEHGLMAAS